MNRKGELTDWNTQVGLIKIEPHFSGGHFDDKFITFRVASCIIVPDPIFCMALFCEISFWNHISDIYHGEKYHFWTKSYHVTPVANNVANPLILYMSMLHDISPWYSQTHLKENMTLTLTRNFKIDFHWYGYEIMPWYYVMILWVSYYIYFGSCDVLLKNIWYKTIQNFDSLRYLFLKMSSLEFDNYRRFRASAGFCFIVVVVLIRMIQTR